MKKLITLIFCILLLVGFVSCSQPGGKINTEKKNSDDDPVKAFEKFVKAIKDDDFKAIWGLMSKESREQFKQQGKPSFEKFKKEIEKELSDKKKKEEILSAVPIEARITAEIKIKCKKGDTERTETIKMVKEDDKWKINLR
ncbi:MAG: DUF4878 domain-containing protein [Candidatus Eremiobacteraeota bacterium]|nr:DUF4878 domain-containing protein [Candidatus Eremiobacteraeota bacterium]